FELAAGRRREFVALMKGIAERQTPTVEFLEYMAEVFDSANREHDYCETLLQLFDLFYASGNFRSAADCLDRAAEVDAYEPGHQSRLEMLRGKVAASQYRTIAERLSTVLGSLPSAPVQTSEVQSESTALDDLMVQAQIYLRYSMQAKAREKLARIQALYPGQEANNLELRELYAAAGLPPVTPNKIEQQTPATVQPQSSMAESEAARPHATGRLDEVGRMAGITRNLYRQNTVNSVLFAAVNDLGRYWNVSRCLAVLCTPGKPPSIALEYCAPGLRQSDIHSIVKLVALLQPLAVAHGALDISAPRQTKAMLKPLRKSLSAMGIESLLAVPLLDGEEHSGLLVLSEEGSTRDWLDNDADLLRTMAEQVVLAVHNVRLRRLVKDLAVTEEKSGLVKRSSYIDVALAEVARAQRQDSPVSVMLMNLGDREELHQRIGQAGLEATMRHVAQLVTSNVRQNDIAIRYDAATIAVILADTSAENAVQAAEKLRRVAAVAAFPGQDVSMRISIGVAQALTNKAYDPADLVTEMVNRADRALEQAILGGAITQPLGPPLEYCAASA
ncbi:MAG TPA: sensor domain-containing diguanylate cyclase, partial [Terriglobales bacterium]|nr:sensor domain-containing diguanylate cyclase [Terriglobales bacterium]